MRRFPIRLVLVPTLALACAFVPSLATALTVTSTANAGPGTLRQALADASDGDTIDFALGDVTITLASELVVGRNVTITGPVGGTLALDGDGAGRVLHVSPGAVVAIANLVLTGGNSGSDGGGCVYNEAGTLTLTRVIVHHCSGAYGGGILSEATHGSASLHVVDSTIRDNHTTNASGGGIYNDGTIHTATLDVERCTISGNAAQGANSTGGGLINSGFDGGQAIADLRATTVTGNTAAGEGGGTANSADATGHATMRIASCTYANNSGDVIDAVYNRVFMSGTAALEIGNTILATGVAGTTIENIGGTTTSAGFNLASDAAGGGAGTAPGGVLPAASDRRNTDPLLGPLLANGGPTATHALLPNSPAIDQGKRDAIPSLAVTTDQRGMPRPTDDAAIANASGGDGSDIGAFEVQPPPDVAVIALKVPKTVGLKAGGGPVTKTIKVTIQNRGAQSETVPDAATLGAILGVHGTALGAGCAAPAATLVPGKTKLPVTIKSKKKLTATFAATFSCAVDPAKTTKKDPGHTDFRWVATFDREALGELDAHTADDLCPRPALPNGVDPRPDPTHPIKDKGCGGKFPDKTLGADVTTDVIVK